MSQNFYMCRKNFKIAISKAEILVWIKNLKKKEEKKESMGYTLFGTNTIILK